MAPGFASCHGAKRLRRRRQKRQFPLGSEPQTRIDIERVENVNDKIQRFSEGVSAYAAATVDDKYGINPFGYRSTAGVGPEWYR